MNGTVYLLHFTTPLRHARHYIGWSRYMDARLEHHRAGTGARLPGVIVQNGGDFVVARTWENVDRNYERRLKRQHNAPRLCPICNP